MPGLSRRYVGASVPHVAANWATAAGTGVASSAWPRPSKLNSLPSEDAQGNVHRIRRLYACSFASGARDTAESVTSWFARWTTKPSNPSAIAEQDGHPAV